METKITKLFDIEHPIIQGGMHYVGFAELAAAVSNAGGLGIITALTQGTPEKLGNEIDKCKALTDKPFGVNLTFLPSLTPPDYPGLVDILISKGIKVVETAGNNPKKWLPILKENNIKVIITPVAERLQRWWSGTTRRAIPLACVGCLCSSRPALPAVASICCTWLRYIAVPRL